MKPRIYSVLIPYLTVLALVLNLGCDSSDQTALAEPAWEGLYQRAQTARAGGHYSQAESLFVEAVATAALPPNDTRHLQILHYLAELRALRGATTAADSLYRLLLDRQQDLPPYHPLQTAALSNWARLHRQGGQYGRADSLLQQALTGLRRNPDRRDVRLRQILDQLSDNHRAQKHFVQAESLATLALGHKLRDQGYEHFLQQRYQQAETFYQRALKTQRRALGAGHISLAAAQLDLAQLSRAQDQLQQAENHYKKALSLFQRHPDQEPAAQLEALDNYANLLHQIKRPEEAAAMEEQARQLRTQSSFGTP
ncbi:MAG: tetratricopeptide repeat protein [Candidatus Latescibacteria bacterium]|nr:tetratricopeptide repeat protein [Candidatus Latescibacterota bacterium]